MRWSDLKDILFAGLVMVAMICVIAFGVALGEFLYYFFVMRLLYPLWW